MKKELVEGMEKWKNKETGDKLRRKLITCLREKPIKDFCSHLRKFERLAKKTGACGIIRNVKFCDMNERGYK